MDRLRVFKLLQLENISHILATILVSHPSKFKDPRLVQPLNILIILFTLLVSNVLRSRVVRLLQPRNISSIFSTMLVFRNPKPSISDKVY